MNVNELDLVLAGSSGNNAKSVENIRVSVLRDLESDVRNFLVDENGATAIEYGLIAAATGLALVMVMPTIKNKLGLTFNNIANKLN